MENIQFSEYVRRMEEQRDKGQEEMHSAIKDKLSCFSGYIKHIDVHQTELLSLAKKNEKPRRNCFKEI